MSGAGTCAGCGAAVAVKPKRVAERLLPRGEASRIMAEAQAHAVDGFVDAGYIKRRLAEFDQFEYYVLNYRCPACGWSRTQDNAPYTEEEARALVAEGGEAGGAITAG